MTIPPILLEQTRISTAPGKGLIQSGDENHTFYAGPGKDVIQGGDSPDTVYGGAGDDELGAQRGYY